LFLGLGGGLLVVFGGFLGCGFFVLVVGAWGGVVGGFGGGWVVFVFFLWGFFFFWGFCFGFWCGVVGGVFFLVDAALAPLA